MRTKLITLFLVFYVGLEAREIVPGVVSFDAPSDFYGASPSSDPGDNPFELSQIAIVYRPKNNPPRSFRQFSIGIGVVGYEIGAGKQIVFKKLSPEELKKELMSGFEFRQATNRPVIQESLISGKKAYFFTSCVPTPSYRKGAVFWYEVYYVPFEQNRGVTLELVADSEESLAGLRDLIKCIKIPVNPRIIIPQPPPEPTPEERKRQQIQDNLREVTSCGEQYLLMHRGRKATFREMLKDFPELAKLTSVDGENYEVLVFDIGDAFISINTKSLGAVQFPPKR
jgi:hypothetical protein